MSLSLSVIATLYGNASDDSGNSLLATLYGFGGQSAGSNGLTPSQALQSAEQNQAQDVTMTAAQPQVSRAIQAFTAAVKSATSVQQLLGNPAVMQVLLTANGLADQIPYTALAQKALTSNLSDPQSLANTLTDTRWKSAAQTYDFAAKGLAVIQNPSVISTITNAYAEVTWRNSLDATTPGLSNALTFRSEASTITSVDQILGDPVMRTVVTTALGIPQEIAFQDITAQETAISTRIDVKNFQDPKYVESFVQRYLINAGSAAAPASTPDLTSLAIQASGLVV
ncbi:MAG TPA: DUF1217 domain-containing protein [Acetobacteraceae bacterium]